MSNVELAVRFFLQIAVILLFCRLVGVIARRLGQPQVVAEMVAGVLLGPSCLGWFFPEWQQALFPWDKTQQARDTQCYLYPVSQLGLALYMFVVGVEFRLDLVRSHLRSAVAVSVAGMLAPFLLGASLAWVIHARTDFFPPTTSLFAASLFLGASMCITAFPMLARIIQFKGLTGTTIGAVAIGAGALNDAAAWGLLALVLGSLEGQMESAVNTIGGGVLFVLCAAFVIKPLIARSSQRLMTQDRELSEVGFVICLALMAMGSWFTELIGLHAVFGAFVIGACLPRGAIARDVISRVEPLTVALLPLFFAYSGLNTQILLLDSWSSWGLCGLILVAAMLGKGGACWLAARGTGLSHRESLGIGTLMNARGLMELIIINIGLQRGIISPSLFAALVVMAVVTTLMTTPLFDRLVGSATETSNPPEAAA